MNERLNLERYCKLKRQNLTFFQEILPVFVPSILEVSNGSEKAIVTFNEIKFTDSTNLSKNLVTTMKYSISTSTSSPSALVVSRLTKMNQTRKFFRRKNGRTAPLESNSSLNNNRSMALMKNSYTNLHLPNNSNSIDSSDSLLSPPNNFPSSDQNLQMPNKPTFLSSSANTPQKIFLHKALFPPFVYEPNIMIAFTRRIFDFVANIMRPFSMT